MRPPHRIERPAELDSDGYAVTVRSADGDARVLSFRDMACEPYPQELLRTLIAAMAWACGPTGGWDSYHSAYRGWQVVRRLIMYLAEAHPDVTTVDALTPEIWWDCRAMFLAATKQGGAISPIRKLLRHCDRLPATTRVALRTRSPSQGRRKYAAHTRSEYARIWRVARRVFRLGRDPHSGELPAARPLPGGSGATRLSAGADRRQGMDHRRDLRLDCQHRSHAPWPD